MNEYLLFKFLTANTDFTNKEALDIISHVETVTVKKGMELKLNFNKQYEVCFVTSGLLGLFVKKSPEQVVLFTSENEWGTSLAKLYGGESPYVYRAIEQTEVFAYTAETMDRLFIQFPALKDVFFQYYQQVFSMTMAHVSDLYILDSEQRYKKWTEENPKLAQRVPQYLVASYLGLLPTSLSRIRKQIHKK